MVGDNDRIGAELNTLTCVFGFHDALDDQWAIPHLAEEFQIVPIEIWIEGAGRPLHQIIHIIHAGCAALDVAELTVLSAKHAEGPARAASDINDVRNRQTRWRGHPIAVIRMALTDNLQVQCYNQRRAVCRFGTLDQRFGELTVLLDIELEPEGLSGCRCYRLDRADTHRREGKRDSEGLGCLCCFDLTIGVLHAQQSNRRDCNGHLDVLANHLGAQCARG